MTDTALAFLDGHSPPPDPVPNIGGRPALYDEAVAMTICERVANGEHLKVICEEPGFPSRAAVYRWMAEHEDFKRFYEVATKAKVQEFADEIIIIADASGDTNHQIKTRQWRMTHEIPEKYGDVIQPLALPAPTPGDNAKVIDNIDNHPLATSLRAWDQAIAKRG